MDASNKYTHGGARSGAGRKPAPEPKPRRFLQVEIEPERKAVYVKAAQKRKMKLAAFVRMACDRLVDES